MLFHDNPNADYDSNFWLSTVTVSPDIHIAGEEHAYEQAIQGAVGGAAGVVHQAATLRTDCQPNDNIEALRIVMDKAGIEARPLWKPMHKQPVYRNNPAYVNGISEQLFATGLCLPSGPMVSDEDAQYIIDTLYAAIR